MESLKFTNAIGNSATWSETSKYRWLKVDDLGSNNVTYQTISSPYQEGTSVLGDAYFESKIISLDFAILSSDLIADMRSLNQILNPKLGVGQLEYTRVGITYLLDNVQVKVLPTLPGGSARGNYYQKSTIIFDVLNPLYSDQTDTTVTVGSGQYLFSFPLDITDTFAFDVSYVSGTIINNTGDVETPITLEVPGAFTAPLTITNNTTGDNIVIQLSLTDDQQLIITTALENTNVLLETISTGVTTSAFNYIDVSQTNFFNLARGNNQIIVTSQDFEVVGTVIAYKNKYVGV